MKIVVDINHPSHVHFFKNFVWEMERKGHQIFMVVSGKDVALELLNAYRFPFLNLRPYGDYIFQKMIRLPLTNLQAYNAVRPFSPDIFMGFGSIRASHVSWLMRKPCVIFDDDEYSYPYYRRFANTICVFSGFKLLSQKIIRVPGYKELAYLHPNWFLPTFNLHTGDPVVLLRFVSWTAFHDTKQHGFSVSLKEKFIKELEKCSKVYITSEAPLPGNLEKYRIRIKAEDMHRFLSGVTLLVCDSQTMTTEAALMGIPAVRCNSFVGDNDMGNFIQLEQRYNLIFNYRNPELAMKKAVELIKTPGLKTKWNEKRNLLLKEKIDVTAFMVWLVENYPDSVTKIKASQDFEEWAVGSDNTLKGG